VTINVEHGEHSDRGRLTSQPGNKCASMDHLRLGKRKGRCVNTREEQIRDGKIIALQSLSNAQLIQILQNHDGHDELTQMVEDGLARRKTEGAPPMTREEADRVAKGDRVKGRRLPH
jgi:hypothetical protein